MAEYGPIILLAAILFIVFLLFFIECLCSFVMAHRSDNITISLLRLCLMKYVYKNNPNAWLYKKIKKGKVDFLTCCKYAVAFYYNLYNTKSYASPAFEKEMKACMDGFCFALSLSEADFVSDSQHKEIIKSVLFAIFLLTRDVSLEEENLFFSYKDSTADDIDDYQILGTSSWSEENDDEPCVIIKNIVTGSVIRISETDFLDKADIFI